MQQEIKTILMLSALAHTLSDATMLQARTVIPANPPSRVAGMNKTNYPRIDGSTSTIPLGQLLAARVLGHDAKLSGVPVRSWSLSNTRPLYFPTATPESQTKAFWEFWKKRANHTGTHEAYEALAAGKTDLILVARLASVDELKAAGKVAFDARPIARDALIYIVNLRNTVPSLTLDQLRGIYGGKHKLWRELGGLDFPVLPLVRNRNSGSQELMETLLMKRPVRAADPIEIKTDWGGKETTTRGPNAMIVTSMGEIIERVAKRPEAIAPSVYYYEKFMNRNRDVRVLALNGVTPNETTLADGTYPLVAPVYVVTRTRIAPTSTTAILRDWLLSSAGQKLVAESGYVPASKSTTE